MNECATFFYLQIWPQSAKWRIQNKDLFKMKKQSSKIWNDNFFSRLKKILISILNKYIFLLFAWIYSLAKLILHDVFVCMLSYHDKKHFFRNSSKDLNSILLFHFFFCWWFSLFFIGFVSSSISFLFSLPLSLYLSLSFFSLLLSLFLYLSLVNLYFGVLGMNYLSA